MREALHAIHEGMSVSKASTMYGIPRTTLNDHKLGKVKPGVKAGPPPLLSTAEEDDLVKFLLKSADIGYGRTRSEVMSIVTQLLARKGVERTVSNGWWNKFLGRHPVLRTRTPATLSMSRAKASSRECIDAYFDLLERTLQETGLAEYPALYFNMDETGFAYDPKPSKTVHLCGERNVLSVSSGSKAQVTVITCVSATGQAIPPLIIWKRKTMAPEMAIGEIPGTHYGFSESGWTNSSIFDSWFKKLFLRYAPASRPLILFMDGHSSHFCPDTLALARENGIIIFTLPPNTTHLLQPLDKGVFGPFKAHWKRVCHDFKISHPGKVINDYNFCRIFSKAWLESMTISNIAGGFRTTGIHPLNRHAIQLPGEYNFADKMITPNLDFTPFKSNPLEKLCTFTAGDIKTAEAPFINQRPNCLKDRIKGSELTASTAFTVRPPNVFNFKQGHNAPSKYFASKYTVHEHVHIWYRWFSYPGLLLHSESSLCHSTAVEACLCPTHYLLSCPGSSVGRALMPRKWRVVSSNPTQGSSFFFEKRVALGLLNCLPLPCL